MKKLTALLLSGFFIAFGLAPVYTLEQTSAAHASTVSEVRKGADKTKATGSVNDIIPTIKTIVNIILFLIGAIAVIVIIVAGFRFVVAGGDSNTISQAKNTIIYALVGLIVAFAAFAIVNFVAGQLKS